MEEGFAKKNKSNKKYSTSTLICLPKNEDKCASAITIWFPLKRENSYDLSNFHYIDYHLSDIYSCMTDLSKKIISNNLINYLKPYRWPHKQLEGLVTFNKYTTNNDDSLIISSLISGYKSEKNTTLRLARYNPSNQKLELKRYGFSLPNASTPTMFWLNKQFLLVHQQENEKNLLNLIKINKKLQLQSITSFALPDTLSACDLILPHETDSRKIYAVNSDNIANESYVCDIINKRYKKISDKEKIGFSRSVSAERISPFCCLLTDLYGTKAPFVKVESPINNSILSLYKVQGGPKRPEPEFALLALVKLSSEPLRDYLSIPAMQEYIEKNKQHQPAQLFIKNNIILRPTAERSPSPFCAYLSKISQGIANAYVYKNIRSKK